MIAAQRVSAMPPALRLTPAKYCASAAETSVLSDSAASDAFAATKMLQSGSRNARSGPAETVMTSLSGAAARHGMSCSVFTTDPSAGEFTRGMEMLARAPDDSGVSSRAVAIQDDYLMKLLATRPIAAVPALPQMSKQLAAPAAALARSAIQAPAGQSPAPVILQSQVSSSVEGPIAAARTVLGGERFAGLRARLLQHQDEFLQQIFDLHRCVRRQRQLVAVCDQPDALVDAVQSLLALPSDPAVDGGSAPAAAASPVWVKPQDAQVVRPVAAQHALVAQPPPGPYAVHGRMAVPYSGPGPLYKGALLQPAGPAPFDPLTAWYCRHYAAPPAYAATAPVLSHAGPAGSFPLATYDGAPGYGYAPTHAVAPWNAGMPPCSASAGGPHVAAAAYDARVAAAPSHGDRWWQDPAQVFGPAGVPGLVARASTLQAQSGGVGGAGSMRRGNEAQSQLQAKAKTMRESESVPLKKRARSFASTHDDRERAGTVSGSNSPGGAGSSHPPKSAAKKVRNGPARKRRGTSSSSGVGSGGKGSDSSGAHGPSPGALQSAASVLLSFSAMTE